MGQRQSPRGVAATAGDAADRANDATAAATTNNNNMLPRSMPLIKVANSSGGDDNDAPTVLLLARFIQKFCLWIDGPVVVADVLVWWGVGDMNRHVPRGDADGKEKKGFVRAVVLLLAK
jgi:hypothetical protein